MPAEAGVLADDTGLLPAEVTPAVDGPRDAAVGGDAEDGSACVALASVSDQCPADWAAAIADQITFCAEEAPFYDAFVSIGACRGSLHYTKYLFDAGPRFCLYNPTTGELVGYAAFDGKAGFERTSCGTDPAELDDQGCAGTTCAQLAGGADGSPDGQPDRRGADGSPGGKPDGVAADGSPDLGAAQPCVGPLPATSVYCPATFDEPIVRRP